MKKLIVLFLLIIILAGCQTNNISNPAIEHEPIVPHIIEMTKQYLAIIEKEDDRSDDKRPIVIIQPEIIDEKEEDDKKDNKQEDVKEIVIIYTSDMHGELRGKVSYSNIKSYKDKLEAEGKAVILVDDGDAFHGNKSSNFDKGAGIINIMNETGYDYMTLGNHDFAYGHEFLENLKASKGFKVLSTNIIYSSNGKQVYEPYSIIKKAGLKIALIGLSYTAIDDNYKGKFKENGEYVYKVIGKNDIYETLQNTIDEVRDKVDCVVVISHTAGDKDGDGSKAIKIIKNTSGIDVFLSGHSHKMVESRLVKDSAGKEVLFSVPGSHGDCFGVLSISKEGLKTTLITDYKEKDEKILALENELYHKARE